MNKGKTGLAGPTTEPVRPNASFNVQIDAEMDNRLRALSAERKLPKSIVVRTAIRSFLAMEMDDEPTCSNGQRCLCPKMWARVGGPDEVA